MKRGKERNRDRQTDRQTESQREVEQCLLSQPKETGGRGSGWAHARKQRVR